MTGHIPGCDRHFMPNEPILARVRDVKQGWDDCGSAHLLLIVRASPGCRRPLFKRSVACVTEGVSVVPVVARLRKEDGCSSLRRGGRGPWVKRRGRLRTGHEAFEGGARGCLTLPSEVHRRSFVGQQKRLRAGPVGEEKRQASDRPQRGRGRPAGCRGCLRKPIEKALWAKLWPAETFAGGARG